MTESKKEWVTPELIVLVRSKPEEAVLAACKRATASAGSGSGKSACYTKVTGKCVATQCSVVSNS